MTCSESMIETRASITVTNEVIFPYERLTKGFSKFSLPNAIFYCSVTSQSLSSKTNIVWDESLKTLTMTLPSNYYSSDITKAYLVVFK